MSSFVRSQHRLFKQILNNSTNRFVQQNFKFSQQKSADVVVNRKKKYFYTAFLAASLVGFGYYVQKEREYGIFLKFIYVSGLQSKNSMKLLCLSW